uniref:Movement protein TGBp3 n=1 Tax=Bamboo mosaic virus TaxID=35286 RepID=A0A6G8MYQ9_9VIRU|nr:triple gene block 3 [Bamboo mosaic virus]QIN54696.1 triple gene block 3 [Bamboo mosaic virus]QIN54701.1 triple gene block 3 [Bamboo mosaic virus]
MLNTDTLCIILVILVLCIFYNLFQQPQPPTCEITINGHSISIKGNCYHTTST